MRICNYSPNYFEALIAFLRENWAKNHTIYEKSLFDGNMEA